jgi:alpha-beta hydrolase superfamily lysophospholipase
MIKKISLITKDGMKIAANLYSVEKPLDWFVLSHMMPATKESYKDLATKLQNDGYESITIDLRGHGESDDGPEGFFYFKDEEHQKSILDLEAAANYLIKERKATPNKISFIGASIGANLSLQYITNPPAGGSEFQTAILLSPGLNYRGIKTEPMAKNIKSGQNVFFVSAADDGPNAEENKILYELTPDTANKKIQIYKTGGHGTDILKNQQELYNLIIEFLK